MKLNNVTKKIIMKVFYLMIIGGFLLLFFATIGALNDIEMLFKLLFFGGAMVIGLSLTLSILSTVRDDYIKKKEEKENQTMLFP